MYQCISTIITCFTPCTTVRSGEDSNIKYGDGHIYPCSGCGGRWLGLAAGAAGLAPPSPSTSPRGCFPARRPGRCREARRGRPLEPVPGRRQPGAREEGGRGRAAASALDEQPGRVPRRARPRCPAASLKSWPQRRRGRRPAQAQLAQILLTVLPASTSRPWSAVVEDLRIVGTKSSVRAPGQLRHERPRGRPRIGMSPATHRPKPP